MTERGPEHEDTQRESACDRCGQETNAPRECACGAVLCRECARNHHCWERRAGS